MVENVYLAYSVVSTSKSIAMTMALVLSILLSSCNRPSESKVRESFLSEHPTYSVVDVVAGEGDGAAAYFRIRYKRPNDDRQYEDNWQYVKESDGKWKLNHRETVKP